MRNLFRRRLRLSLRALQGRSNLQPSIGDCFGVRPTPRKDSSFLKKTCQAGQSLVEFALLFPVLLLILLGAIDLGRAFNAYVTITNASREGARYGSTHPTNATGITARVNAELSGVIVTNIAQECAPPPPSTSFSAGNCTTPSVGDQIRVTVTTSFEFLTLYLFGLPNIPMSNFTIMAIAQTN